MKKLAEISNLHSLILIFKNRVLKNKHKWEGSVEYYRYKNCHQSETAQQEFVALHRAWIHFIIYLYIHSNYQYKIRRNTTMKQLTENIKSAFQNIKIINAIITVYILSAMNIYD